MRTGSVKRRIFWLFIGLILLVVVVSIVGIFIFKNVLLPGQQQRVINILPIMEIFLWRPPEGYTLPTPFATSAISPEDLLEITLEAPTLSATSQPDQPTLLP